MVTQAAIKHTRQPGLEALRKWDGMEKLPAEMRPWLIAATNRVYTLIPSIAQQREELARALIEIQGKLKPLRLWTSWMEIEAARRFGISRPTVNRLISSYKDARRVRRTTPVLAMNAPMPEPRGEVLPPKKPSARWEENIDVELAVRESVTFSRRRLLKVREADRFEFLERHVGMMMSEAGMRGPHKFAPVAVPEDWLPNPVGRPEQKAS